MIVRSKVVFILFLICYLKTIESTNVEYDGWIYINLQHALVPAARPVFIERGNITVQSLRLGTHVLDQKPLPQSDRIKLRDLAANNGFYQLKSTVTYSDGTQAQFLSTTKACMLAEAELNDILSVSLDYTGKVLTVTNAVSSTSTCEGAFVETDSLREFSTRVFIRHVENGPMPDTVSYIQKLEREREAKERGDVKDNRSFLGKYWMYILPVVIIMVLSSAANPEAAGGGR